jgi:hypothetical protein
VELGHSRAAEAADVGQVEQRQEVGTITEGGIGGLQSVPGQAVVGQEAVDNSGGQMAKWAGVRGCRDLVVVGLVLSLGWQVAMLA